MTSEAKIAANRRNARRSTGPRTAAAKARVRRNALRHGLAASVVGDHSDETKGALIASAICGSETDHSQHERASIVVEAHNRLRRVRDVRTQLMERMTAASRTEWAPDDAAATKPDKLLDQLLRLDRYERRAAAQWKRAARLAAFDSKDKCREKPELPSPILAEQSQKS